MSRKNMGIDLADAYSDSAGEGHGYLVKSLDITVESESMGPCL